MPTVRPIPRALPGLVALLLALLPAPPARADDKATAAGAKARAGLPEPVEGKGLAYDGELWVDGVWGGTVRVAVEAGELADKPCWLVTEDVFWDLSGTEWRVNVAATLRRDLSVERAEIDLKVGPRLTRFTLARAEGGWKGQKQVVEGENEGPFEDVAVAAPPGATLGLGALALLARGPLPAGEPALGLTWLDAVAFARGGAQAPAAVRAVLKGEGAFEAAPGKPAAWSAALEGLPTPTTLFAAKKERALLGLTGWLDAKAVVLPAGQRPQGAALDEKGPARTWQAAFLKFGVGYHMAKRELLEEAFDWKAMYEYESSLEDGWPASKPLAEFKEAWIGEFLAQSLKRNRAETNDLLTMTLTTGRLEEKGPDRVIFHAHANFGGGQARAYHLRRVEGVWFITRMVDD